MTPEEKAKIERMLAWDNMDRDSGLYKAGWNEALEKAAKYIESRAYGDGMVDEPADDLAAAIRALKDKPMTYIAERLRRRWCKTAGCDLLRYEAADEIEWLRKEVEFLRDDNEAFCGHACPRKEIERLRAALGKAIEYMELIGPSPQLDEARAALEDKP